MLRSDALAPRFARAWRGVGAHSTPPDLLDRLLTAWNEPGRHYHSEAHLFDGLARMDGLRASLKRPNEVEIAWWFHDAIQVPGAPDNEHRSADWATEALTASRAPEGAIQRIAAAILATRHRGEPATPDEAALLDLDLAILGANVAEYDAYAAGVRAEYAAIPDEAWRAGRAAFLRDMLTHGSMYHTASFHDALELKARANLMRELAALD
ncbi:hypothetical protein LBMAG42_34260 [Deltaproteobacteria bacterium]|nr:hypothetical protein LBMAG42_34260 [Deltaproteobacteria bacterium]